MGKVCSKCGRDLPYEAFGLNRNHTDGFQSHCRDCVRAYDQERERGREPDDTPRYCACGARLSHYNTTQTCRACQRTYYEGLGVSTAVLTLMDEAKDAARTDVIVRLATDPEYVQNMSGK